MTRLEYYSGPISGTIILLLVGLSGLIVFTIIGDLPKQTPALAISAPLPEEPAPPSPSATTTIIEVASPPLATTDSTAMLSYITVTDSCDYAFQDECVRVRSGPGLDFPVVAKVRNGMVLRADTETPITKDGQEWYKIRFDETLRYKERLQDDWYIASEFAIPFFTTGPETLSTSTPQTTKRIEVDRSEQMLRAYDGDSLILEITISTGRTVTPTPRGEFTIFYKTPSRYMQGPLPGISDKYYDLPGVPWNLYFTHQGAVVHGAYWHESFGSPYSNGCVNVPLEYARTLYEWADLGTTVLVRD